jgi:ribosomal protein S18 acetylase RimI-like enzyme
MATLELTIFPENCMNERTIERELAHGFGFVAQDQGIIIGYLMARTDEDIVDITRLGVQEDYRQQGIGRALLCRVLTRQHSVMLHVRKENRKALRLYRNEGFDIIGEGDQGATWVMLYETTNG